MAPQTAHLLTQALALDESERAELAEQLLASLSGVAEDDAELAAVVERRMREIDSGAVETVPWEEVRQRLRQQVGGG